MESSNDRPSIPRPVVALPWGSRSMTSTRKPISARSGPEIDRRGGLAHPTLLVGDGHDARDTAGGRRRYRRRARARERQTSPRGLAAALSVGGAGSATSTSGVATSSYISSATVTGSSETSGTRGAAASETTSGYPLGDVVGIFGLQRDS